MARGFESKSVADQQESAQDLRRPREAEKAKTAADSTRAARLRQLQLARADVERRLAVAVVPAHRQMLERALSALQDDFRALE
jgi:hypothetical protein